MNTTTTVRTSYSRSALRRVWARLMLRRILVLALIVIGICLLGGAAAYYLANLPRERRTAHFTFLQRVKLGASNVVRATGLTINAHEDNPMGSPLTKVELFVDGASTDRLTSNLPASGEEYQPAYVRINGDSYQAEARLRGDSVNHWAFPQKSWRIKLKTGELVYGMASFNLNLPRTAIQIENWLGNELARRFESGLLVPLSEMVHFRFNRVFDGVRLLIEQPNEDFLARNNLPQGKIYVGDISTLDIYSLNKKRKLLFDDITAWELRGGGVGEADPKYEMAALFKVLKQSDLYKRAVGLASLVEMDQELAYMALLELVGSTHVDNTHNHKYYFNPLSGKFAPIVWDTVAFLWGNARGLDLLSNDLFTKILTIPEYREKKDALLLRAVKGPLSAENLKEIIRGEVARIRNDMQAFALKLKATPEGVIFLSNEAWDGAIDSLLRTVESRVSMIERELSPVNGAYTLTRTGEGSFVDFKIKSRTGAIIKSLTLDLSGAPDGSEIELSRMDGDRQFGALKGVVKNGQVSFNLNDHLYSLRSFIPRKPEVILFGLYRYRIALPNGASLKDGSVEALHGILNTPIELTKTEKFRAAQSGREDQGWWDQSLRTSPKSTVLQGEVTLSKSLELEKGDTLTIKPGAHIKMARDISIISRGGTIIMRGTDTRPIHVKGASDTEAWGGIALQGGTFEIAHSVIEGGSDVTAGFVHYDGALSAFNAQGEIRNSKIEGELSFKNSTIILSGLTVRNERGIPYRAEGGKVSSDSLKAIKRDAFFLSHNKPNAFVLGAAPIHLARSGVILTHGNSDKLTGGKLEVAKLVKATIPGALRRVDLSHSALPELTLGDEIGESVLSLYIDTNDKKGLAAQTIYGMESLFKGAKSAERFVKDPLRATYWPISMRHLAASESEEAEFAFRVGEAPFTPSNLPLKSPWYYGDVFPLLLQGEYKGIATSPAKYFKERSGVKGGESLAPLTAVITERRTWRIMVPRVLKNRPRAKMEFMRVIYESQTLYTGSELIDFINKNLDKVEDPLPAKARGKRSMLTVTTIHNERRPKRGDVEQVKSQVQAELLNALQPHGVSAAGPQGSIVEWIKNSHLH